ncbi:MAG TPA: YihY/virulence factor BrkB family protein [Hyphomicrobiales bacterium]|nr:YihY/virulence factor BrkB family protein [Hyphomicrobiales bacterium]
MARIRYWAGLLRDAVNLWLDRNAFSHAGSLAFYTLFSLAPVVIIAVTIIGVVLGPEAAQGQIVEQLEAVMGLEAAQTVERAVASARPQEAGFLPSVLGIGALVVGATTVFAQMQYSLNMIWGVAAHPKRNSILVFLLSRLFSLTIVLSIGFVLLVSLLLGVALRSVLYFADTYIPVSPFLVVGSETLLSLGVVTLLFATIFKVLPDVVLGWKDVLVGALLTSVLFSLGRYGIATYLSYTAPASVYGAAGSVVLILMWVYYSSLILFFGAAFTKVHLTARGKPVVPRNSAALVEHHLLVD